MGRDTRFVGAIASGGPITAEQPDRSTRIEPQCVQHQSGNRPNPERRTDRCPVVARDPRAPRCDGQRQRRITPRWDGSWTTSRRGKSEGSPCRRTVSRTRAASGERDRLLATTPIEARSVPPCGAARATCTTTLLRGEVMELGPTHSTIAIAQTWEHLGAGWIAPMLLSMNLIDPSSPARRGGTHRRGGVGQND